MLLKPAQYLPHATLALGSAMVAFMYTHTIKRIFAAKSAYTIRENAVFLPAYTVLLGLIALLGYMTYAGRVDVQAKDIRRVELPRERRKSALRWPQCPVGPLR